ncbi:MAG: phosphoglycerate kinase [Candidatus Thorarchaeota archaeon]|jgi:phosphoglycerate kinase|nr:phosphoglycerate kinase [Candidatus Thorarchaeota archaeon]
MKFPFKTLDDVETKGKRVLVRVDINCSVDPDTKKITDDSRIDAIVPTLKELSKSKVVLMAHQGRPGSNDFISLEQHTEILQGLGFNAIFVDDIFGDRAKAAIEKVQVGEILVLQNVRMFEGELKKAPPNEVAKEAIVQELYPLFDLFVNDAFGAAHRSQASIVGFTTVLPSVAGRLVEKEIRTLTDATAIEQHPWILVFGGAKVAGKVKTLDKLLATGRVDKALLGGLLGQLFLIAKGLIPTEYSAPIKGFESAVETAKELLEKYPDILVLPQDAAVERDGKRVECAFNEMDGDPFFDIGPATATKYMQMIRGAAVVFSNGPLGLFEKKLFATGTISVLNAIAECEGVTVVGGGHLGAMAMNEGFADRISHISTGGGATINFLTGKKLDLVVALEEAARRMV